MTQKTTSPNRIQESQSEPPISASTSVDWRDFGGKVFESRDLFGSLNEVGILHEGALYRLKITRQGKLILNK